MATPIRTHVDADDRSRRSDRDRSHGFHALHALHTASRERPMADMCVYTRYTYIVTILHHPNNTICVRRFSQIPSPSSSVCTSIKAISSVIVPTRRLAAEVRGVGERHACLLPNLELTVLCLLARRSLVLGDGRRTLAVRRCAQSVADVWVEIERRRMRHRLQGSSVSAAQRAKGRVSEHIPGCPKWRSSSVPSGSALGSRGSHSAGGRAG